MEKGSPSFCKKRTPFARGLERRIDKEELKIKKQKANFSAERKRPKSLFSGSPTILAHALDSWLCVPAFRQVCHYQRVILKSHYSINLEEGSIK